MAYFTATEFVYLFGLNEFEQLTDKDQTGEPSYQGFNNAVGVAKTLIDSALSGRYAVPLTVYEPLIKEIAGDITRYYLYDDNPTPTVEERYKNAIDLLHKIKLGSLILGSTPLETVTDTTTKPAGLTSQSGSAAIFTDGFLAKRA
jgi:phage gp36-like protein